MHPTIGPVGSLSATPRGLSVPGGDATYNAWLDNFVTYAGANLAK